MKSNKKRRFSSTGLQASVAMVLVLAMLLGTAMTLSAKPPLWQVPEFTKETSRTHMRIGETVRFTITVRNPGPPANQAVWEAVRVWDQIDPAFRIDRVNVTPQADDMNVTNNLVWVEFDRLQPGESFVVTIDCTLVGPIATGSIVGNSAALTYEDPDGLAQQPICSGAVKIVVTTCTWKPPQLIKTADNKRCLAIGDSLRYTIVVANFIPPWNHATWYNMRISDDIDPALRIDNVSVDPPADDVTITGNTVVVTFDTLAPGESYEINIDVTLVGPVGRGKFILNRAIAHYLDVAGNPQPPWESDLVRVCTHMEIYLPIIRQNTQ